MNKLIKSISALACSLCLLPHSASAQGWPSKYQGVMLQGFYWDSFDASQWTNLENQADEFAQYFKLVWVPQSAYCGGKSMGYNDLYWFTNYNSSFGTEAQLRSMIKTFKQKGIGTIADVVINHRGTIKDWFDFPVETYNGKTYTMSSTDVCANDDKGKAATAAKNQRVSLSKNNDSGEDWDGMRDLDHNSENVQNTVKDYLRMLIDDFGYTGFRYDMTKGYDGKFTGLYNSTVNPEFSVGEYWDGNKSVLMNWLQATKVDDKIQSAAFDFTIRYTVRDAANNDNWSSLSNGGLATNNTYKRYAVTFVENHDTEKRSESEQQDPLRKDTLAANAYILGMPGTPCVFYKHWIDCKQDIKNMILLRNRMGINNESKYSRDESASARFVFTTTGENGKLRVAVGRLANKYEAGNGFALAAEGYHWRYFIETTQETAWPSLPSGTYYNGPKVTLRAVSATATAQLVYTLDDSEPTANSNVVANGTTITLPSGNITLKVGLLIGGNVTGIETRQYEVKDFKPYTISVYVNTDKVGWTNTYFWTWGGDESHGPANKDWPGDNVTKTTELNGKKWFTKSFSINTPTDYVNFVFAKDKSTQTVDMSNVTATSYFEIQKDADSQGNYLVKNVTNEYSTAIFGINDNGAKRNAPTVVNTIDGRNVRRFATTVDYKEALHGLDKGLYIVNGKKVVVR